MLRVDSKKPCKLVYSLCKHPYMGFVIEPHIVQLNANGSYSLSHQKLYSQTAKEFDACLDEDDYKLIKLFDAGMSCARINLSHGTAKVRFTFLKNCID